MSLRVKISLLSVSISGAILVGFGLASWHLICHERLAALDREIRTLAARHPGWLANRTSYERLTSMLRFTFGEQRQDEVILWICDPDGKELYRSPHWPSSLDTAKLPLHLDQVPNAPNTEAGTGPRQVPGHNTGGWGPGGGLGRMGRDLGSESGGPASFTKSPRFLSARAAETLWRLGILGNAQTTVVMGINGNKVQDELNQLRDAFLLTLPVALVLVAAGGWITSSRALRPLRVIADTAERVTARGLDQRIPPADSDPEVDRVVCVLNRMMDRLEKSFHQATRFTADASHELKTPLTIMQGELDNALQAAAIGSKEQQVFGNLLEETQRLKNITRNLLLLAQADSGQLKLARQKINLTELLENTLEDVRVLAVHFNLEFDVRLPRDLQTSGDPNLLSTAVHNVLGNAVKYNEPAGRIALEARANDGHIEITVSNTGAGIQECESSRLFKRFFRGQQRGDRQREGNGLGLSLAREILRAHGGDVVLKESRPGWTTFVIHMPDASA